MRKLFLLCSLAAMLSGCAPNRNPVFGARDERTFPDPALGIKNSESETYSTQIMASPSSTPAPAAPLTPATHKPTPAPAK